MLQLKIIAFRYLQKVIKSVKREGGRIKKTEK